MIRASGQFMRGLAGLSPAVRLWVGLLGTVNMIGGIVWWDRVEGRATLLALGLAFVVMVGVVAARGFVRLTGVGHLVAWLPLLIWMAGRPGVLDLSTPFGLWTVALFTVNGISLVIDALDVVRYVGGDRAEMTA